MAMRIPLLILISVFSLNTYAQPLADSLFSITKNEIDSVRVQHLLDFAEKIQNKDVTNCIPLCDEVIRITESKKVHTKWKAKANFIKGLSYYFAGEHDKALNFYLTAIKEYESIHDEIGKARVLNELGVFYRKQKNNIESDHSFKEAYSIADRAGDKAIMATSLSNLGVSAQESHEDDTAIHFFAKAQSIYEELNDSIGISYTKDYASVSFANKGMLDVAIKTQKEAYQIRLKLNDSSAAALSLVNLAEFETLMHHSSQAELYFLECLSISEKINNKELTAYCYKQLAAVYAENGNNEKAYLYHLKYSTLNEDIFNENRSKQINELQTKYETEKKTQQIELLTRENQLKESKHRNQRNILLSLLALISILGFAYHSYSKHKKQKEIDDSLLLQKEERNNAIIEAEEKERVRIARDLHDGVAQTMVAAKMQLESFIENTSADLSQQTHLKNAFDLVKDASNEVRSISHSMIPNALLKSGLVAAVRDFVQRMGNTKLKINLEIHGLNERLDSNVETVIFRVLQELINNIIKHAKATEITIQLIRDSNELTFIVEDNGIGFDKNKANFKSGIGMKNIESRISYLNGTVDFDSTPNKGTTVVIEIPLSDQVVSSIEG